MDVFRSRQKNPEEQQPGYRQGPEEIPCRKAEQDRQRRQQQQPCRSQRDQQEGEQKKQAEAPGMAEIAEHAAVPDDLRGTPVAGDKTRERRACAQRKNQFVMVQHMDPAFGSPVRPGRIDAEGRRERITAERRGLDAKIPDLGALHGRARIAAAMRLGVQRLEARKMQDDPFPDMRHDAPWVEHRRTARRGLLPLSRDYLVLFRLESNVSVRASKIAAKRAHERLPSGFLIRRKPKCYGITRATCYLRGNHATRALNPDDQGILP